MEHILGVTDVGVIESLEPDPLSSSPPAGIPAKPPISYEALKSIVQAENNPIGSIPEKKQSQEDTLKSLEAQETLLRLQAERNAFNTYHDLRKQWAMILKKLLYAMVGFEAALTFSVGFGWLHFPSQVFLNLIVGQTFLQIVGMCYIVVKFLFPNEKDPFETSKAARPKKESSPARKSDRESDRESETADAE